MTILFRDAAAVKAQISSFLAKYPEVLEDSDLLSDMLDGETDINTVLEKALDARQEALFMAEAIKGRISDLTERMKRFERTADGMKDICRELMLSAGLEKVTLPEATLSITKPRTSVEVINVDELPQGFFRIERKADKKAILSSFEAGMSVPGAALVKGDFGLTVRVK